MKLPLLALLYAALSLGANPVMATMADAVELQAIIDMREGDMRKLKVHGTPIAPVLLAFTDVNGVEMTLAESNGKFRLVNFWATWCAPCREEMPELDALNQEIGGETFAVMTIATGRNRLSGINEFYAETEISSLPILLDPKGQLARSMGVLGLPVTVLLDPEGNEVARLTGGADWNSENAKAVIAAIMAAY